MHGQQTMIKGVIELGPLVITNTVLTTWAIIGVLWLLSWLMSRRLRLDPGPAQTALEGVVAAIEQAVVAVDPQHARQILPFIGSLWIFLVVANLSGLVPGVHAPTRDLSATAALAVLVFLSTHWYGLRIQGFKNYLTGT